MLVSTHTKATHHRDICKPQACEGTCSSLEVELVSLLCLLDHYHIGGALNNYTVSYASFVWGCQLCMHGVHHTSHLPVSGCKLPFESLEHLDLPTCLCGGEGRGTL